MVKKANVISRDYQTALHNYWVGRPRTSIEHLSKLLADDPDRDDRYCLYRLWIEILADMGEANTLRTLNEHLFARGFAEPEYRHVYMALRGLIYFEIDEIDAAMLLTRATESFTKDHYCQELAYHVKQRFSQNAVSSKFIQSIGTSVDYYHLQTQARAMMILNNQKQLKAVMHRAEKLYPQTPLVMHFDLHKNLEEGRFEKAKKNAIELMNKYPGQMDYTILGAFAAIKCGDNDFAVQLLEKAVALGAEDDIDAAALLGSCYTDLYQKSMDDDLREKASIFLDRAAAMMEDHGISAVIPSYHSTILSETQNGSSQEGESAMAPSRLWLVRLTAPEFHEIRTQENAKINHITRPIGPQAKVGDVVFMVADDYRSKGKRAKADKQWRIAAVYTVASDAKWHPFHGYESSLQLISKPSVSIPVDVHFTDAATDLDVKKLDKDDPRKYGVYELDYAALDVITNTIREHNVGEEGPGRILEEIDRMRHSS